MPSTHAVVLTGIRYAVGRMSVAIEHSFGARSGARFTKKMFSSCNVRSCSIHATFRAGRERFETSPQNALDVIAAGTVA